MINHSFISLLKQNHNSLNYSDPFDHRLDATDADINLNGALDYSITSGNVPARFEIHARTGTARY